jgi:uncharacterized protein
MPDGTAPTMPSVAAHLGDDHLAGIVLYTGQPTLPFGPRFRAMPVAAI